MARRSAGGFESAGQALVTAASLDAFLLPFQIPVRVSGPTGVPLKIEPADYEQVQVCGLDNGAVLGVAWCSRRDGGYGMSSARALHEDRLGKGFQFSLDVEDCFPGAGPA